MADRLKLSSTSCKCERMAAGFGLFQAVLAGACRGCSASEMEPAPANWNYPGQAVGKLGWIAGD